jgi:hypothetical protein
MNGRMGAGFFMAAEGDIAPWGVKRKEKREGKGGREGGGDDEYIDKRISFLNTRVMR